jgi:hypothetical protein
MTTTSTIKFFGGEYDGNRKFRDEEARERAKAAVVHASSQKITPEALAEAMNFAAGANGDPEKLDNEELKIFTNGVYSYIDEGALAAGDHTLAEHLKDAVEAVGERNRALKLCGLLGS